MSSVLQIAAVPVVVQAGSPLTTGLVLAGFVGGAWLAWRAYARQWALGLGAVSVLPAQTLIQQLGWPLLASAGALVLVVAWNRWSRTASTVTRWGARARRKSGVASSIDVFRKASRWPMRRSARTVRPSLGERSWWARRRMATSEVAALLCRVGVQRVWSSVENVIVVFGGPRMGKSTHLVGRIIDAPGAVLVTSTRTDLFEDTRQLRQQRGPVLVFNPAGLAGIDSTITFNPLTGCADPVTASERAHDMIAAAGPLGANSSGGDRAYWDGQARRVLAAFLHAAALGGVPMAQVANWVADPDFATGQLSQLLRQSPEPGFASDAEQFLSTNDRTRTSITSTIMPALAWLTHPAAARAATGEQLFNVAWLLEQRATVYLLGGEEAALAPLVCALTGYIAREARRIAAHQPGGRLDPPLTMVLDEAALICPIPLDRWSADMGGRGVCIIAAFQSRAQLIDRYGPARAATILNNAASKVLFGGTSDRDDLQFWSTLAGDRDEPVTSTDIHRRGVSRTTRRVPVLAPAQLSQLPKHRVVVFTSGMPPVVGWAERAWTRADVRAVQRPDALGVRIRAWRRRAVAAGLSWTTDAGVWLATASGRGTSAVSRATTWLCAELVALIARFCGPFIAGTAIAPADSAPEPTPANPIPTDVSGAQVIPFPADEWPVDAPPPAWLPVSDWPSDDRHPDNDAGRWN
jgi:type IV secretory pathway TraG/TraD family ATPase VirD4